MDSSYNFPEWVMREISQIRPSGFVLRHDIRDWRFEDQAIYALAASMGIDMEKHRCDHVHIAPQDVLSCIESSWREHTRRHWPTTELGALFS